MRKIILCLIALVVVTVFYSCQTSDGKCHISGEVVGEKYEGKRIFLIPFYGAKTHETVDSIEIKDGKFSFVTDSFQMYKILLDLRYRMGLQPLIVVGEPGNITVTVDSVSHATGTPLHNKSKVPAPFLRVNLKGADGEQILPAVYSDNYITLMPGEQKTVTIHWRKEDARGQQPNIEVTGIY